MRHSAGFRRFRLVAFTRLADRTDHVDLRAFGKPEDPNSTAAQQGLPPSTLPRGTYEARPVAPPMVACPHSAIGRTGFETWRSNDLARLESTRHERCRRQQDRGSIRTKDHHLEQTSLRNVPGW